MWGVEACESTFFSLGAADDLGGGGGKYSLFFRLASVNVSEIDWGVTDNAGLGSRATGIKKPSESPLLSSPDIIVEFLLFL